MCKIKKSNFKYLLVVMPDFILRKKFDAIMKDLLPHAITRKVMERLDRKGRGPKYVFIKNAVAYRKEDFVKWVERYIQP